MAKWSAQKSHTKWTQTPSLAQGGASLTCNALATDSFTFYKPLPDLQGQPVEGRLLAFADCASLLSHSPFLVYYHLKTQTICLHTMTKLELNFSHILLCLTPMYHVCSFLSISTPMIGSHSCDQSHSA